MYALQVLMVLAAIHTSEGRSVTKIAGGGTGGDGSPAIEAKLDGPFGLVETPTGSVVFVEMIGHRVREVGAKDGRIRTIAGTGCDGKTGDGPASAAEFNGMHALAVAANSDLYIADTWNNRIRKIDAKTNMIMTIAGTGEKGFSGDGGPAIEAKFGGVYSIAISPDGATMYVADLDNRRIRAIDLKSGTVSTVAGDGRNGVPVDGADATASPLVDPRAVAVDGSGHVYILERGGHALRVVDSKGKIRTVVGSGKGGPSGDCGPGLQATLNGPKDLTIDRDGTVLIADTENHVIRRFRPSDGTISRVAGTGQKGSAGVGGDPLKLEMSQPHGITVAKDGAILISDSSNNRILKIER